MSLLLDEALVEFKRSLAIKLIRGFSVVACIALPLSLLRWFEIGFQAIFILHISVTLIILYCNFRADRTNYRLDFLVILVTLSSMIVAGMFAFGLQSGVVTFSTFTSFIVAILWGIRPAIVYAFVWCLFVLGLGYLFVNDIISYSIEPQIYSQTYGSWVIVAMGSSMSITFTIILAYQGFKALSQQLERIEIQRKRIEYLADHDAMTGYRSARLALPMLENAINAARRNDDKVAVVFVDLNEFKKINDTLGHETGDEVLTEVAARFKQEIRERDIALRIGGDEFLFVLPDLSSVQDALDIVERITFSLLSVVKVNNHELAISASAGVAIFPDDSPNPTHLRNFADQAMYCAKKESVSVKLFSDMATKNSMQ